MKGAGAQARPILRNPLLSVSDSWSNIKPGR